MYDRKFPDQFLLHLLQSPEKWNQWVGAMIEYKGYLGWFAFNETTGIFQGKVVNAKDLITFQGKSIEKTHQAFRDAVDSYLAGCQRYGREPEKISEP